MFILFLIPTECFARFKRVSIKRPRLERGLFRALQRIRGVNILGRKKNDIDLPLKSYTLQVRLRTMSSKS